MELFLWIAFAYLLFTYLSDRKKVKQLQSKVNKLQKGLKGENQMSVLLKELVGSKAKIRFDEELMTIYEYSILAVDEDWVKISRELATGEMETKLVRVDNIVDVTVLE
ncbi:hypothetical protein [Streptococcus iners]|uniref:Uncharacterized protein n=1 Tax=Streptococcus iners subsp. hyiners TaxID=3028083 RepID=A0AA97A226_9STRE|nr:hypothetical protein [Streptococcus sp. 29892]MCK3904054.1 hypothetical protein [Streptococcus suis]MCK4029826.1 hypothetical protein [Streptococcus suis]NQN86834.1 hypothetical protein [Streptococcus suis]WNY48350.1 hypothetical protein PW220_06340 [Streptococcus sp. 29892]